MSKDHDKKSKIDLTVEKGKRKDKVTKLREFKENQYKDLVSDYTNIRENLLYMKTVLEEAMSKIESSISKDKGRDDMKISAKLNAISQAVYANMQINDQIMKLHEKFDEIIDSVIPEDVIKINDTSEEELRRSKGSNVLQSIDPLNNVKRA